MTSSEVEIPLFPLQTVLFPGGPLPLRVFERRYVDMVSECMRGGYGFGVCLIREGGEVGEAADVCEVGTLAEIFDWDQGEDGILQIIAMGQRRFRVLSRWLQADQLSRAQVRFLNDPGPSTLPQEYRSLAKLLRELIKRVGAPYSEVSTHYDDAVWVGGRLFELLPLPGSEKQQYLAIDDPMERLHGLLRTMLRRGMI